MISQYWVGQIPGKPLSIQINDEEGFPVDLSYYDSISFRMLGSNNETIDLTGYTLVNSAPIEGRIVFKWPTDRSLFQYSGDYVFQIQLDGTDKKDFTNVHTIRVRELGRSFR